MSRILPDAPCFRKLLEKHGADYEFSTFFDKNLDPLPDAPGRTQEGDRAAPLRMRTKA